MHQSMSMSTRSVLPLACWNTKVSGSTRNNRGKSHENRVAEHAHYRSKDAVDRAFILRGSRGFHTDDDYDQFVGDAAGFS